MAPVDALITQRHIWCPHFTGDHGDRVLILGQVVRPALGIGHDERGRVGAAARAAGPLHVVRRGRRHVPQYHRLEFTDVHAQLERGRAGQGVDLPPDEALLDVRGLGAGQLAGVLVRAERDRIERPVQVPVVVIVLPRCGDGVFLQHPAAAYGRADIADRYRGQAAALPAAVHHVVRADRGELQPGVFHLADDAEPSVVGGAQPPIPLAFQEAASIPEVPRGDPPRCRWPSARESRSPAAGSSPASAAS